MNVYDLKKRLFADWSQELLATKLKTAWNLALDHLTGVGYATAPASTKYHLCVQGGLLIHSVCVTEQALRIHNVTPLKIPREWILAAGLLHDVGKAGMLTDEGYEPRYKHNPKYNPQGQSKWNAPYEWSPLSLEFGTRDLSGLLVARWGFPWPVVQAVLVHDGAYVPANAEYSHKGHPLSNLLMTADTLHAQTFETKDGIILF